MLTRNHLLAFLISFALISLELAWTRIFSAEFFYTFAFLVLSLAVAGLGLGALSLRLVPALGRTRDPGALLVVAVVMALAGPVLVFRLGLDFTTIFADGRSSLRLVAAILLLAGPFFWGGAALGLIFRRDNQRIAGLYMADLVGAGLGVPGSVVLMNLLGTPTATVWLVVPLVLATVLVGRRVVRVLAVVLLGGMVWLGPQAQDLMKADRPERAPVIYEHWDASAKLKVLDYDPAYRGLVIDNAANTGLLAFDGNWDRPDSLRFEFGIDVSDLIARFDDGCTFLSLGAGGGMDVMQALQAGCTEIHAVEVVPAINDMLREGEYAEFTGQIYNDPRVIVATDDARSYVRRFTDKFDVIYSLSSNSWAALASGSFALAENYLFTTEAFGDYWGALTADGFMMMEHQFYMPRMVTQLVQALRDAGVERPEDHFAIYALPSMRRQMMLLSRRPLTDEIRNNAFGELTPQIAEHIHLLFPPRTGDEENLINRVLRDGWQAWQDSSAIDLSPATDDRPFVAQLGLWRNVSLDRLQKVSPYEFAGFPVAKLLIGVVLAVAVGLLVPLLIVPAFYNDRKLRPVPWLYFFLIGAGYLMVEVVLIQKYTLFVGPPLLALLTVLTTMLLASGCGSQAASRFAPRTVFTAIALLLVAEILVWPHLTGALATMPLTARIAIAAVLIAPLGFFLGMPFPKAAARVGELVDWGFAVGGVASVIGSTLIVLVAFIQGFAVALTCALLAYLLAAGLFLRWRT